MFLFFWLIINFFCSKEVCDPQIGGEIICVRQCDTVCPYGGWTPRASRLKWVKHTQTHSLSSGGLWDLVSDLGFNWCLFCLRNALKLRMCFCVGFPPQRLCIFDNYGTLVFAIFMSVWGEWCHTLVTWSHLLMFPNLCLLAEILLHIAAYSGQEPACSMISHVC